MYKFVLQKKYMSQEELLELIYKKKMHLRILIDM
jgi:hypothetical protein